MLILQNLDKVSIPKVATMVSRLEKFSSFWRGEVRKSPGFPKSLKDSEI